MTARLLHIVCYDITKSRLRSRISAILEERGIRVQGSVFELWLTRAQAHRLGEQLGQLIDPKDSLRIYPIPAAGLRAAQSHGRGTKPEAGPELIF